MGKASPKPDFKIAYDGTWYHNGARIERAALAKLFSDRALKIDADGLYWLQTPYEKYPVEVEDVPYVIVDYKTAPEAVDLITNMGEMVELGKKHKIELRDGIPYVEVRAGLYARIGRSVYYNLVRQFGAKVKSRGVMHSLGELPDE